MRTEWQIRDLIDLEYFLRQEFEAGADGNGTRKGDFDREAFLSYPDSSFPENDARYRRGLIRHWLVKRREAAASRGNGPAVLPGDAFAEAMRIARLCFAAAAFVIGAVLAWSLLSYTGRQPVNVFTCLWVLVAPQVLFLLVLILSAVFWRIRPEKSFTGIYPVVTVMLRALMRKLGRFAGKRMAADRVNRLKEAYSLLGRTKTVYGSVFFWPVFLTAQLFGIFFNLGILCALFVKVAITDLAFGWQTTLQAAPESVLRLAETVALPWSWLFDPPVAHPGLDQIAGSRMILKEGIFYLSAADMAAWWPFVFLVVAFYGLLPRLLLAGAGLFMKRRALSSVDFSHGACDRLLMRMKTPRLDTQSMPYPPPGRNAQTGAGPVGSESVDIPDDLPEKTFTVVLIPPEMQDAAESTALEQMIRKSLGLRPATVIPVQMEPGADAGMLREALAKKPDHYPAARIVTVQEAWQPPIKENMAWLKSLRAATGGTNGMIVALAGKPREGMPITSPSDTDRKTWTQAVDRLGDPWIRTEVLGGSTDE